ncbi:hypothetical protein [Bacillus sp. 165]|uniref:hypothetical protein n=1 Tax=Bacillus sp. 165 TaxID=1529117 RepID=UPI001AD98794|nr:hypothetical protein [Bacillus sp. 165]MBO9128101.1 hypothetical protein [Bacillus sp. 165]
MKALIILAPIICSAVFLFVSFYSNKLRLTLDILAYISLYVFGIILSLSIHEVLQEDAVFMTKIHEVLLNPLFLGAGAYAGIYALYLVMRIGILYKK